MAGSRQGVEILAYAEKRGNGRHPWRARYKRPDGTLGSEPGFRT